ncbi:MAG TPA: amino acid adenylation domain-containing protein, partial [Thermoanaerobaculia bacterium]
TPDAVAVSFEGESLRYRELDARADGLAERLRRLGVRTEDRVGICAERSLELVVGLLGILKAGAAYVPLDPSYPRERLAAMLEDAGVPVLLTVERLLPGLPAHRARTVLLDAGAGSDTPAESGDGPGPDNLAYVLFTSGSTGRPKGAMITHRAIVNRLLWMQDRYGLGPDDRVLQKTPFSFDVSVWEFFWPLLTGARLVLARPGGHQDSRYLARTIAEEGITVVHFVPSMLRLFLEEPEAGRAAGLTRVIASGEALPPDLRQLFFERLPEVGLENLYGPTEAAVDVTFWDCRQGLERPAVPIGRPVANTCIHLLDPAKQPVPLGVAGELHIGGVQVARGYLGRPDLTAERFLPDPTATAPGERLYATGDLVRRLPDGALEFLGRIDHQVKIRGFRIEIGEIEAVLGRHPAVRETLVLPRRDESGEVRLVAYLVHASGPPPPPDDLKRHLREALPEHMVPSAFVLLDAFPLTPNGKVDRGVLATLGREQRETEAPRVAPRTETERRLAAIWKQVLRVEEVGVHESFFELGGNSLLLLRLNRLLYEAFGRDLAIAQIFATPTISGLARFLTHDDPVKDVAREGEERAEARKALAQARRQSPRVRGRV